MLYVCIYQIACLVCDDTNTLTHTLQFGIPVCIVRLSFRWRIYNVLHTHTPTHANALTCLMDVGGTSLCIMVTHQLPTPRPHSRPPHIIMWNMSKHHIIMMQSHPVSVWIQRCALNPPSATHTLLYTANYPKCYLCEVYDFADFAATRSISVDVKVSDVLF